MRVEIPADIVERAQANGADLRLAIAIQFYADNRIDYSDACRLAGVKPEDFNKELCARAMSVLQYPIPLSSILRRTAG